MSDRMTMVFGMAENGGAYSLGFVARPTAEDSCIGVVETAKWTLFRDDRSKGETNQPSWRAGLDGSTDGSAG